MKSNQDIEQFLDVVKQLQKHIRSKIDSLNQGGCGVFTLMFYMAIKDRFPEAKISIYSNYLDVKKIKTLANEINQNGNNLPDDIDEYAVQFLACSHVMVRLGDYHIDGYDIIDHEEWDDQHSNTGYYTLEELKTALIFGSWNTWYERDQNPKLQKLIEKHLKCKIEI